MSISIHHLPLAYLAAVFVIVFSSADVALAQAEKTGIVQAKAELPIERPDRSKKLRPIVVAGTAINPAHPQAALRAFSAANDIWLDAENHQVVIDGEICLTRRMLEMFACPKATKEHESIVAVATKAYIAHTALLAAGGKQGSPVKYYPKYSPASGSTIRIDVYWNSPDGKLQTAKAQDWIRNTKTQRAMEHDWVFGGSGFYVDEKTKQQYYLAEQGDFICVVNFPSAMLDLNVASPEANDELLFEAFSERIPPRGTKVKLVLTPHIELSAPGAKPSSAGSAQ